MAAKVPSSPPAAEGRRFDATVSAITDAFGDPTRRGIYLRLRDEPDGLTAAQLAETFGVHPNVARHHLDKLAAGGYVEVSAERAATAGAGRPSKRYRLVSAAISEVPVRVDELVLTLLSRALAELPRERVERLAESVGSEYGATLAKGMIGDTAGEGGSDDPASSPNPTVAHRSFRSAMQAVADALTAHGFAAHTEQGRTEKGEKGTKGAKGASELQIVNQHCPFGAVAVEHPVICAIDRGMVRGMLATLYGDTDPATESSVALGDSVCTTIVGPERSPGSPAPALP